MTARLSKLSVALNGLGLTKEAGDVSILDEKGFGSLFGDKFFTGVDNDKFLDDNKSDIKNINKLAEGHFKPLGRGAEGVAFAIGRPRNGIEPYVLKITFEPLNMLPEDDEEATRYILWNEHPGAKHEAAIHMSGKFLMKSSEEESTVWWKITERTNQGPLTKKDIEPLIYLILRYIKQSAMKKAEKEATTELEKEEIRNQSMADSDLMNTESATILDADKPSERTALAKNISQLILSSGVDRDIIEFYDDILEPGWFEDFIDGILYQMAVRGKGDFGPRNLGIRESTGRLIWFDA